MKPDSMAGMPEETPGAELPPERRWLALPAVFAAIGLFATLLAGIFLRSMYFDERGNLSFLWLIAQGERPYQDFWCTYPAAGFSPFMPLFGMLPDRAADLIVLRAFSVLFIAAGVAVVCLWSRKLCRSWWLPLFPAALLVSARGTEQDGIARIVTEFRPDAPALLLAFISMALLFADARGWKRVVAMALAIVSTAMMPKYTLILIACLGFDLMGRFFDGRWEKRLLYEYIGGGVAGVLISWLLTWSMHSSLLEVYRWSFLVQARFQTHAFGQGGTFFTGLLLPFIRKDWPVVLALAAGFAGFLFWAKTQGWRGQAAWIGYGLFCGLLLTGWRTTLPFEQYLPPVFLPWLFYFPFLGLIVRQRRREWMEVSLLAATAGVLVFTTHRETYGIANSALFSDLSQEDLLLSAMPKNERVLGAYGVIFRRPQTYVTYDETWGKPPGFGSLVADRPLIAREFSPERLRESLEKSKPGLIHVTSSLPPGWLPIVEDFLQKNQDSYRPIVFAKTSDIRNDSFFIRADLLEPKGGNVQKTVSN